MTDFEKVTQGLLHHKGNKTPSPCDGCPYDDDEPYCSQRLAADALSLLKEQEEKIESLTDLLKQATEIIGKDSDPGYWYTVTTFKLSLENGTGGVTNA